MYVMFFSIKTELKSLSDFFIKTESKASMFLPDYKRDVKTLKNFLISAFEAVVSFDGEQTFTVTLIYSIKINKL